MKNATAWGKLFILICLAIQATASAQNIVKFDGSVARTDRVLAKLRMSKISQSISSTSLAKNSNVAGMRSFSKIPGVVVIDLTVMPKAATAKTSLAAQKAEASKLTERIRSLKASGLFEYVEPDYLVQANTLPNDTAFTDGSLWGLRNLGQSGGTSGADIDAVTAWQTTTGSRDVIVGVIDSGVRYTHQDLVANMWVNAAEIPNDGIDNDSNGYIDDIHGINAITLSGNPMDDNDHGTHCAGTIGAAANGGGPLVGVAWNVQIMALKFLDASGSGSLSDAIAGIDYGVSKGADILSNSWGGGGYSQALYDAIERANAAGILFVAAAGNHRGNNDQSPNYPSNYENANVVAVAALDRSDALASFSCFGANTVDIGAPGVAIYSCTADSDSSYAFFNGTSMATPHVSGVAALIKSRFPTAGAAELSQRLLLSARPVASLAGKCVTGGAVNAAAALSITSDGALDISFRTSPAQPRSGATVIISVTVKDFSPVLEATVRGTLGIQGPFTFVDTGSFPDTTSGDGVYAAEFTLPNSASSVELSLDISAPDKEAVQDLKFTIPIYQAPANDNFAARQPIATQTSTTNGTNVNSSSQVGEPLNPTDAAGGKTVWWSWRPNFSGNVTISTDGSSFDTTLAIYTGTGLGSLNLIGANDDNNGVSSAVSFSATAGTEYLIQVDGYNGLTGSIVLVYPPIGATGAPPVITIQPSDKTLLEGGNVTLSVTSEDASSHQWFFDGAAIPQATSANYTITNALVSQSGTYRVDAMNEYGTTSSRDIFVAVQPIQVRPGNDHLTDATALVGATSRSFGTNVAATKQDSEPNHAARSLSNDMMPSVWWKWTAPQSGNLTVDTSGSDYDTTLAIYTGDTLDTLSYQISNDDSPIDYTSKVTFGVTAGTVYKIAVSGFNAATGSILLNTDFIPDQSQAPANDALANRAVLDPAWKTANGTNLLATGESGEPEHAQASVPLNSVWWEWTPQQNESVILDTVGSDFDTTLAVYTGSSLGDLSLIAANDDYSGTKSRVTFTATAGTTYLIAVDGYSTQQGQIQLNRTPSVSSTLLQTWMLRNGLPSSSDPLSDSDSDGFSLVEEFLLGGTPTTGDGAFIQPVQTSENGYLVLRWRERVSKGNISVVAMSADSLMPGAAVTPLNSTDAADQSGVFDAQAFVMREAKIPIVGEKGFIWLKTSID
jgi:hypothetical protein